MNPELLTAATLGALIPTAYAAGRLRPASRLLDWADRQAARRAFTIWTIPAGLVLLAAQLWFWTIHPFRTRHRIRAARVSFQPIPAPPYDPHWAARRTAAPTREGVPQP